MRLKLLKGRLADGGKFDDMAEAIIMIEDGTKKLIGTLQTAKRNCGAYEYTIEVGGRIAWRTVGGGCPSHQSGEGGDKELLRILDNIPPEWY